MRVWAEPFTKLRLQKIFNLFQDPFERADITSNTFWDWQLNHIGSVYGAIDEVVQVRGDVQGVPAALDPAELLRLHDHGRDHRRHPRREEAGRGDAEKGLVPTTIRSGIDRPERGGHIMKNRTPSKAIVLTAGSLVWLVVQGSVSSTGSARARALEEPATANDPITPAEARAIAREAYIYGFPLVDSYRIQYSYFVDRGGPEFKAPWNEIHNDARVYTPDDKAIQTPNSDTPYSQLGADLRAEPLVLTVPVVEAGRYYSLQFIDLYTFNFAYVGSRATGNDGGRFLLAGPNWQGEKPEGIKAVIRSETEFAFVLYRTQLFKPDDIDNVKKIQAGYKVQTLSEFPRQARTARRAEGRFPRAAHSRAATILARILQRPGFRAAVLSHPSVRDGTEGAFRQARHRTGGPSTPRSSLRRFARRSKKAWPTPGRNSPSSRRPSSIPENAPVPTASGRGSS